MQRNSKEGDGKSAHSREKRLMGATERIKGCQDLEGPWPEWTQGRTEDPNGPKEGLKTQDTQKDSLRKEGNDGTRDQKAGDLTGTYLFLHQAF
jgi:hypothetical protein